MKYDKEELENKIKTERERLKGNFIPASIKDTYSDLVSKKPVLVSRELLVDGRPLIGLEYAPNGDIANVYTTDTKGKRINFENSAESNLISKDVISIRLDELRRNMHTAEDEVQTPAPKAEEKKRVIPKALKPQQISRVQKSQQRA